MIRLKPGNSHICKRKRIIFFYFLTKEVNTVIWIFPVLSDNLAIFNVNVGSLVEDSIVIKL